jgi:hypothetical protein
MNLTPKRIIRFILGALLPVPFFVGIYYFPYFHSSYCGFDHESKMYMTSKYDIEMARQHLKTDVAVFLTMGYSLMGLPSLASVDWRDFRTYCGLLPLHPDRWCLRFIAAGCDFLRHRRSVAISHGFNLSRPPHKKSVGY